MFSHMKVAFREGMRAAENPRQGFYIQVDADGHDKIKGIRQEGVRLILLAYNLNGFQSRPLDEEKLLELDTALTVAAEQDVHVVFRAAYGFAEGWNTTEPAKLAQVLEHIEQIVPVLNRHAQQILCVQAGMLGPWGEWHSSRFLSGNDAEQAAARNRVAATWLEALAHSIPLHLRRPAFVRQAVEAGMPLERLGFHNDALLASDTDMGTYSDGTARETELKWVNRFLSHGLFGGEMPAVSSFTTAENAVREFRLLSLTYLNSRYNTEVLDSWDKQIYKGENALTYISRHIGCRLYLSSARIPKRISRHSHASTLTLTFQNSGFAPPQPGLCCYLAVRQNDSVRYRLMGDLSKSASKGDTFTLTYRLGSLFNLDAKSDFELGVWLGFGHPEENGFAYTPANDGKNATQEGDILYFHRVAQKP